MRLWLLLVLVGSAQAEPGWILTLPHAPQGARTWIEAAGWEEQRGSAAAWRVAEGALYTHQSGDSTTIGTKKGFPIETARFPILKLRVMATILPKGAHLKAKSTEDAALRVFVLFDKGGGFLSPPCTLGYAIGSTEPVGSVITSERFEQVKYIVVASGPSAVGKWLDLKRDLLADYRKAFGAGRVPAIKAVGIKSDGNNTNSPAAAVVSHISLQPR